MDENCRIVQETYEPGASVGRVEPSNEPQESDFTRRSRPEPWYPYLFVNPAAAETILARER